MIPTMESTLLQIVWLLVIAIPVACVAWTCTHEEVFREPREFCQRRSTTATSLVGRKIFYVFTCEYCFSHYVAIFFLLITGYKLLYQDWRGYLLAWFALVWVANQYMSVYNRIRLDIRQEGLEIAFESRDQQAENERKELKEKTVWSMPGVSGSMLVRTVPARLGKSGN